MRALIVVAMCVVATYAQEEKGIRCWATRVADGFEAALDRIIEDAEDRSESHKEEFVKMAEDFKKAATSVREDLTKAVDDIGDCETLSFIRKIPCYAKAVVILGPLTFASTAKASAKLTWSLTERGAFMSETVKDHMIDQLYDLPEHMKTVVGGAKQCITG